MPLLPAEPCLFPGDLFNGPGAGPAAPLYWLVLYTRARAEKALARNLLRRQIGFFLPLYEQRWQSRGGRSRRSYLPLFPGYIFLYGTAEARLEAMESGLVSRCLPVPDQCRLHQDLARVYHLVSTGLPLTPEERLEPGSLVEFVAGPLEGLQGKILRRGKQLRLVVEVELLQRGVSVDIESHMVRLVSSPGLPGRGAAVLC